MQEVVSGGRRSWLDAAVAFLRAQPGQVSPITVTVWSNDYLDLVRSCGGDFVCVQAQAPAAIAQYASRLALILHRLRTVAPSVEVIVSGSWHPFLEHIPLFDAQFAILNLAIANAATAEDARFADLPPLLNPPGEAARVTAICTLTSSAPKATATRRTPATGRSRMSSSRRPVTPA